MKASDNRYRKHWRAFDLALRMLRHEVRTASICEWSGLSPSHVRKMYKSYVLGSASRHRGVRPRKLDAFLRSPARRSEANFWAHFCEARRLLPAQRIENPEGTLPGIERGHLLCDAFERFQNWEAAGRPTMTMEQAIMLLMAFAKRDVVEFAVCGSCGARNLIDRLGRDPQACEWCATSAPITGIGAAAIADGVSRSPVRLAAY